MKDVVVIGLGAFGSTVALELTKRGCNVLVIDRDEEQVESLSQFVVNAVTADATDPRALKEAGVENFKVAVVSVGEDIASSILITMNLKEIGVDYVVTKATTELQGRILRKIGADRVVFPERDIALRTAESIANPSIFDYIELSSSYGIIEIVAPPQVVGKTLRESQLRSKYGLNLIAIKREVPIIDEGGKTVLNEKIIVSPDSNEKLVEGDVLVLIGKYDDLERFKKIRR